MQAKLTATNIDENSSMHRATQCLVLLAMDEAIDTCLALLAMDEAIDNAAVGGNGHR